ncbi:MAG: YlxR family protein [Caldilineaceae bacterium]
MSEQKKGRSKHVPQRTCIGCRQIAGKRGLLRVVRTADGVVIDATGKLSGRGAYVHGTQQCWNRVLAGNRLAQALRTTVTAADRTNLAAFVATLPVDDESLA